MAAAKASGCISGRILGQTSPDFCSLGTTQQKMGPFFQILWFSSFLLMCKYWCNNENLTEKSSMIGSENFREIPAEECSRYCFSSKISSKRKNLH